MRHPTATSHSAPPQRLRRLLLAAGLALPALLAKAQLGVSRRALGFPSDFGAHEDTALEWWYLTGLLGEAGAAASLPPQFGFQLTFFRLRNRDAALQAHPSRLAARQLLLGHVALSDLRPSSPRVLRHEQRLARLGIGARYASAECALQLRDWRLRRSGPVDRSRYSATFGGADFSLKLDLQATQPVLLQGDAGYSRKGPGADAASHYYSQPHLSDPQARLRLEGRELALQARAWLDHEWSEHLLPSEAQGWDWLGINLLDGGALTAFRLRRTDGSTLWTGGSWRQPDGRLTDFGPEALQFTPGRRWHSPLSGTNYPVEWLLQSPLGPLRLLALADAQEVDARASSGLLYWEGAAALHDARDGHLLGHGYLELTGYSERMVL